MGIKGENMKELLLKVLGGFKKSANIIFSLDEDVFDRFFNNEYFKDGIKNIKIELGNGDTIELKSKNILDFKFYMMDQDKKKEFTKKDVASVFNIPEHYLSKPEHLMLLEEGMKIEKVKIPEERPLDAFIDDPLIRDEDGGYIIPDDIGNEIIEIINKRKMNVFSKELDQSITSIKQSEDEYFDDIKPMIVKRGNK